MRSLALALVGLALSAGSASAATRVTLRLRSLPRRAMCLYATARTRRDDGLDTVTSTRSVVACEPR